MEALLTNLREQIQSEFAGSPQTLDVFERIASSVLACSAATHSSLQTLRSERNSFESQCVELRAQVAGLRSLVSLSGTSPLAAVKQNDTSVSPPESEPEIQSSDTLSTTTVAEEGGRSGPTLELGDMMSMLRLEMEGHRFCSECSTENANDADLCVCCEAPLLQGELEPIRLDEYDKTTGEDQKMSKLRASVEEEASNQLPNDDDAATHSHQSLHVTAATRGIMPVPTGSTTASSSSDGVRNGMELMGNFFSQLPSAGGGGGGGGGGDGGEQGAIRRATIAVKSSSSSTHASTAPLTSSPPVFRGLSLLGNFMQPAVVAEDNKLKNEDDYDDISDLLGKTASGGAIAVRTPTKSQLPSMESVTTEQQQEVEVEVEVEKQQSTSVEPAPMAMNFQGLMKDFSAHGIKAEEDDDDDDEPMGIEIDLAARFQQMAGIYDSKPKDFAREMRDKGSESSSGSIMSSSGLSGTSGSRGETNQKNSVSFAEDSKDGASLEGQVSSSTSSSSNEQAMHANSRAVGGDESGGNGNGEGEEDLYVTRAPKHPTSAQKHRFVGGRSKEPQERTLKEVGDEYIWKKFMNREEEEDTDSDEDEEKVRGLDYKLKVVCQEMRTVMPREDMNLTVFVANAKYKKRYLLGRRKWRYFVSTKVEKKKKKKKKKIVLRLKPKVQKVPKVQGAKRKKKRKGRWWKSKRGGKRRRKKRRRERRRRMELVKLLYEGDTISLCGSEMSLTNFTTEQEQQQKQVKK